MDPIRRTALLAVIGVAGMTGLGFASVPLYRMFCEATGFDGTTQRANGQLVRAVPGKTVEIRFDANHVPTLPWSFAPEKPDQIVTIGEKNMAFFTATNHARYPVTGRATYNVTPSAAGGYFAKVQCFCFTEQTLQPGQSVRMPVIFYVDPGIAKDVDAKAIQAITLSYTFYPIDDARVRG
ncbi:cytochrome c oxidase assembly protein [Sphingomonas sp. SUN039]|uniref:cytochrome c oxidase assembly protein n=1 Tax=Sphingomonas sp. SUN039 TaxID=2937787 RepID=UPI0021644773|nr:cytochrome c oxidase assembly protein [Sphingomonas sp. SUN039]UVO55083.1 cytochrome c oxidase assembly protein [Sphingomonas sp. SUN039]